TNLKREFGQREAYSQLRSRADALRPSLRALLNAGFELDTGKVDLGGSPLGRDYTASIVASRYFANNELVGDAFERSVNALNEAYGDLVESGLLSATEEEGAVAGPQILCIYVGETGRANFETGGRRGWWGWKEAPGDGAEP